MFARDGRPGKAVSGLWSSGSRSCRAIDAGEAGDDDIAGNFLYASIARKVLKVTERLRLRLGQVLAETLVLDERHARPEQINVAIVAGKIFDRLFEARYGPAAGRRRSAERARRRVEGSLNRGQSHAEEG